MIQPDHVETEHVRFKVLSASEEIAGKRTVMIYATHKGPGGTHVFELSPMQAVHLATELLCAVKELKLFEEIALPDTNEQRLADVQDLYAIEESHPPWNRRPNAKRADAEKEQRDGVSKTKNTD